MSLMWVVPIYIVNVAISMYLLAAHWDLSDPVTVCVIVDCAHYIVVFLLLIGIWVKWPYDNANQRLCWIEIFPTFGYVGCIFVIALQEQNIETIVAICGFSLAILRYPVTTFAAMQKKRLTAIKEYDVAY